MSKGLQLPKEPLSAFFESHQDNAKYWLSCSEIQPLKQSQVLQLADSQCKQLWDDLDLGYTEAMGHPLLRQEVAKIHDVQPEDVMIEVPHEGIYVAINALVPYLTQKSDCNSIHVVTCLPCYPALSIIPRNLGCDMSYWRANYTNEGWTFDLKDLEKIVKSNTKLLIVNFPHNPTGFCPTAKEYKKLISFCKSRGIFMFCDEMYLLTDFSSSSDRMPSACELYEDAVSLFGMSKAFAQPGLRLGWLVCKNRKLLAAMNKYKDYFSQCCAGTSEILSIISLRSSNAILNYNRCLVKDNLDLLDAFFAQYTDIFEWTRPRAGTVTLVKVKGWLLDLTTKNGGPTASGLCERLYSEASIMLLPGKLFEAEDSFVRFGFGKADLGEALYELKKFLEKNRPQSA